ncbi:MAG: metallophosphoesterase [Bauldia sp.]
MADHPSGDNSKTPSRRTLLRAGLGGLAAGLGGALPALAQQRGPRGGAGPAPNAAAAPPQPLVSQVLGRPTGRSIALNLLAREDREAFVEFGTAAGRSEGRSATVRLAAGKAGEIELAGLQPDNGYVYRLRTRAAGASTFDEGEEHRFQTARAAGSSFTFTLQGDSHPERLNRMYDPVLYAQAMRNVAADRPDFHLTIGDDFSLDPLIDRKQLSQANVDAIYAAQRGFLAEVGRASAIFLANGNHEQVEPFFADGSPNPARPLAASARLRHFALPAPDGFYSGGAVAEPGIGLPRVNYAWTWGDALFVVFDPYWHSPVPVDQDTGDGPKGGPRRRDWWGMSIGDAQYRWLKATLEGSNARYKFVLSHHILGTGRGGIEMADSYEWGGRGQNGRWEFDRYRPNWEMPIHQLFVKTGVSVYFFGHDHLFARQEKDGVIYQETPMPADPTFQAFNRDAYRSGDILPNSGHLRVSVTPASARVEYVQAARPADEGPGRKNGAVAFAYTVAPRRV